MNDVNKTCTNCHGANTSRYDRCQECRDFLNRGVDKENQRNYARMRRAAGLTKPGKISKEAMVRKNRQRKHLMDLAGPFPAKAWLELCDRLGNKCACCGAGGKMTKDHITLLTSGGTNDISNLQPLCVPCNSRKFTDSSSYLIGDTRINAQPT